MILCGGVGARLWPASTPEKPKPFIDLIGGPSLFQRTVTRVTAVEGARPPVVVTGFAHVDLVRRQLGEDDSRGTIVAEPVGRESAPAIVAAVLAISRQNPMGLCLVVASDHHIPDVTAFSEAVTRATPAAKSGLIVTFGIAPTWPSTAYGYIQAGELIAPDAPVRAIAAFLEKPNEDKARALISAGCLWNSGNFLFRADVILSEAEALVPGLVEAVRQAVDEAASTRVTTWLGASFAAAPKVSLDVGVMERTRRAAVMPVSYSWSDLGAWDAIWRASDQDGAGNVVSGAAIVERSENCLVHVEDGVEVIALGLNRLAVVAERGRFLVCDLAAAIDIKGPVDRLGALNAQPEGQPTLRATARRLRSWLFDHALPTWWCFGADHDGGGFHDRLDWTLKPANHPRRLRVQARQVVVYATAGRMGWTGPWRSAVAHGLDYLEARFRRADGLYRKRVADGSGQDDNAATLYDQAFVLLAWASATRAEPDRRETLRRGAFDLLARLRDTFAAPAGGYAASEGGDQFESDPLMHLFEAAQAWQGVEDAPHWSELADGLARLALDRMIDSTLGVLPETFGSDWRWAPDLAGRSMEPGHQFEWAWLLARWGERNADAAALKGARGLYRAGERGVRAGGLVLDQVRDDFSASGATSRLWPQTERLKSALLLEVKPDERGTAVLSACAAMESYFTAVPAGLWRDSPPASGVVETAALASTFYHIVGAIEALVDDVAALG